MYGEQKRSITKSRCCTTFGASPAHAATTLVFVVNCPGCSLVSASAVPFEQAEVSLQ